MQNEVTNDELKGITNALETSYEEFNKLIQKIAEIDGMIKTIKNNSEEVGEKYSEIFDNSKIKETQKEYQNTVEKMVSSLDKIEEKLINIQTIKKVAEDDLKNVIRKMNNFERLLDSLNGKTKNIDKKLTTAMETLKLNHNNVERNARRALKGIEIMNQTEKYDEIIELQKENNQLLKALKKEKQ